MKRRYFIMFKTCALVLASVLAISCTTAGDDEFADDYSEDDSAVMSDSSSEKDKKEFSALDQLEASSIDAKPRKTQPETETAEAKPTEATDDLLLAPNEGTPVADASTNEKPVDNGLDIPPDVPAQNNVLTEIPSEPTLKKPKKTKKSSVDALLATPKASFSSTGSGGAGPRIPSIPGAAIKRDGILLNRFYFARKGDTPESLASLMYGDKGRKKDLVKWNGKAWTPGKLIYYASPMQAEDREMRSFYQERSVPPEEYTVQAGENIYKVATSKLGARSSWKEIAVINGLTTPGQIEPGVKIALYPTNLTPYSQPQNNGAATAQAQPPQQAIQTPPQQVAQTPPTVEQPQQVAQNDVPPVQDPNQVPEPQFGKKKKGGGGGLDFARLIEQNMFAIAIGGGVFVLVVLLMLVSGRKKPRPVGDDFGEDAFATPKAKRK